MSESQQQAGLELSQALGRIPSGIYILTVRYEEHSTGMLASWVQQAGFEPPTLSVAVRRDRYVAKWIESSRRFTLNQVAKGNKNLVRHFGRGFEPGAPAFEGLELLDEASGNPVLASAMAFLDTEVLSSCLSGDHQIFLSRIVGGRILNSDSEPMIHVRHNGFHY